MKTSYFFNQEQNFPALPGFINTTELAKNVSEKSYPDYNRTITESLELELNSRMEILNQTAMVTFTDVYGTIMYANDLFCSISGYSRTELIGRTHKVLRHPDLQDETIISLWKMVKGGETWQGILKSKRKNGKDLWTKTTVAPVMDEQGKPVKFIWVRHDITDLKQTEYDLYAAKQRADQQLLDNVKNAHRIQSAILPSEKDLKTIFPGAFLFTSSLQSVSGDFYWFTKKEEEVIFALGDGTGHGVSGSFVSLIAITSLEFIVKEQNETDPGKILSKLNTFLYRALNKHKGSELTESVDMAICSYNSTTREMKYASGKSKVYLVRNDEVYSLDRDECSIGSSPDENCIITTRNITLKKGDRIFMMSDGLADQFGGDRNKRMGSRLVKKLLTSTGYLPVQEQKEVIRKYFLLWKGENEQTDDLSLLAFQVE